MFDRSLAKRRPPRPLASAAASTKRGPSWFKAATPRLERLSWRGVFPSASSAKVAGLSRPGRAPAFRFRAISRRADDAIRTTGAPAPPLGGPALKDRAGSSADRRRPLTPIGGTVRPPARSRRLAGGRRIARPRRFGGGLARRSGGTDLAFERWRKVGASRKILTRGLGVGENRGDPTCAMGCSRKSDVTDLGFLRWRKSGKPDL